MVTAVSYRAPVLLIKAVTTLDALSGGRTWLGVGAGYPGEAQRLALRHKLDVLRRHREDVGPRRHLHRHGRSGEHPAVGSGLASPGPGA